MNQLFSTEHLFDAIVVIGGSLAIITAFAILIVQFTIQKMRFKKRIEEQRKYFKAL